VKAKKRIEVAVILVSVVFISIFIYLNFYSFGYLEVVKAETDPLRDPSHPDIFAPPYRTTAVTLKWHGSNGTLLRFDYLGRDSGFGVHPDQTVNDGDKVIVRINVGWAWVEIHYGLKKVGLDCYGKLVD
jgi:hypothetical protein